MHNKRVPIIVGIVIVAALAGAWLSQVVRSTQEATPALGAGTIIPNPRPLPAFELIDTQNQPQTTAVFKNRWSVVFFGYTSCPDVCPTTLTQLAQVTNALSDVAAERQPQFVFISVDPKRDTPTQVGSYVRYFSPNFIGLTGAQPQIDALTRALGVPVIYQPLGNGDGYTVDHAATLFVIDPQVRVHALFTPPFDVKAITADLRSIVTH